MTQPPTWSELADQARVLADIAVEIEREADALLLDQTRAGMRQDR